MTNLEATLIRDIKAGKAVSLERGLLIISGLKTEEGIGEYVGKLDLIQHGFIERLKSKSSVSLATLRKYLVSSKARFLFEYLWSTKPRRCNSNFLLTDVVDAQLNTDSNEKVGSCVGLTSLYTVLGAREGLNLTILVSGSHILNRLRVGESTYSIDHTDPLGFDCEVSGKNFFEYPAIGLLANVLNSRGIAKERLDDLEGAEEDYDAAIQLNPRYGNAYNNHGNVKFKQGDYSGAIEDYSRAIQLNSALVEAYCNRGIAKESVGDYRGAAEDYDKAIGIDSGYIDAYWRRGKLKQILRDYLGAVSDFERVIELDPESREKMVRFTEQAKRLQGKQSNANGG
jgi:tetratricopeptide (TPR) repeat protein